MINESMIELRAENCKLNRAKAEFGAIKRQYISEYRSHTIRAKAQIDNLEYKKKELLAEMGFVEVTNVAVYFQSPENLHSLQADTSKVRFDYGEPSSKTKKSNLKKSSMFNPKVELHSEKTEFVFRKFYLLNDSKVFDIAIRIVIADTH